MAGRKQHFIPQYLLRNFEASKTRKESQVVVYKKGAQPYTTSTKGVAAQRDFYSPPADGSEATLDDIITTFESESFNPALDRLIATQSGDLVDSDLASVVIVHLSIRAAHTRGSFAQLACGLFTQFEDALSDPNKLRKLMDVDSDAPDSKTITEIAQTLDALGAGNLPTKERRQLERIIRFKFREKFDLLAPSVTSDALTQLTAIRDALPKLIEKGHLAALQKSLSPDERLKALERLQWRVISVDAPAHVLLPDCVAVVANSDGEMSPFTMASNEDVALVAMPISATQILVGSLRPQIPEIESLNLTLAKCSMDFFVSSVESAELEVLQAHIGEAINSFTDDLIADESPLTQPLTTPATDKQQSKMLRVNFASAADKNAQLIKAIHSVIAEQFGGCETDGIHSILVAQDVPNEVARMRGGPLSPYDVALATNGTVEVFTTSAEAPLRIIVSTKMARLLLSKQPQSLKDGSNQLRFLLGRAIFFNAWFANIEPALQTRQFTERVRATLEGTRRFLAHIYASKAVASFMDGEDMHRAELASANDLSIALNMLHAACQQFPVHGNVEFLLADVFPATDLLLTTIAGYCSLKTAKSLDLEPSSAVCQLITDAGLQDWLRLFDRDLREQIELINRPSPSLPALLIMAEHVERIMWQFGIFMSDTEEGRTWIAVKSEVELAGIRQILNS